MSNLKATLIPLIYAVLVIVGGIMGYLKAQSLISLITGLAFGLPLFAASLTMLKGKMSGYYTAFAITVLLTLFFHYRFVVTQTFLPAGLMAIISILAILGMFFFPAKKLEK